MKICIVGYGIGTRNGVFVGGHVNNVINLSKALAQRGFEVHVITTPPCPTWRTSYELQKNVIVHIIGTSPKDFLKISEKGRLDASYALTSSFKMISAIRQIHEKEKFNVVHGHSGYLFTALVPTYLKMQKKVPAIHTLYCPIRSRSRIMARLFLSKLDYVVALTNNVKRSLQGIIRENRIKVIPPLIDLSRFTPKGRLSNEDVREKLGQYNLLYLGNLSKAKGLHILLEALRIVKRDFPSVKLLLGLDVAPSEFQKKLGKVIKALGLSENVIPLGIIRDLPNVMANCDIFVVPFTSTYGPADCPLSILEAMACGLPVVATKIGGIPEIVRHKETGLLVEAGNSLELAKAITYLLNHQDLAKAMGMKGASYVQSLTKEVIKGYIEIYQNVTKM
jgi:glycosyltransferase involved in cell wall biosynthesis